MIQIGEHTIDETILNKNGWVLDLGCIDFDFSNTVLKYCNNIIGVDANPTIVNTNENIFFKNCAIVDEFDKDLMIDYHFFTDKYGNSILMSNNDMCIYDKTIKVPTITIKSLMNEYKIIQFDLIKMDIEGSEYKILDNIDWTISKQYSIEFHDFRNMNPYYPNNNLYYENLFEKMLKYCDITKHDSIDNLNYWDSLFTLKKEYWL